MLLCKVVYNLKKSQVCKNIYFNVAVQDGYSDLSFKKEAGMFLFNATTEADYCDLVHRCTRVENPGDGVPDVFCQNPFGG